MFKSFVELYKEHLLKYSHSLVVKIIGLYRINFKSSRNLYFIVMVNVCQDELRHPTHLKFDLKGSHVGRVASEAEKAKESGILKDEDFRPMRMHLGNKTERFLEQLKIDTDVIFVHFRNSFFLILFHF